MRIGIRAHDMEQAPFEEVVKNISKKGFLCTQLAPGKLIHDFNVDADAYTPGMAFYMKEVFAKNHVDVAVLGCYLNLTTPNEADKEWNLDRYKSHIRFASLLGCGVVGTETGAVNAEYRFEKENHSEHALSILIERLKIVVDYAEKMGVVMGIEPVYSHIMCDIDRTYKVLQAINSPNLQVILDPINLLNVDNCKQHDDIIKGAFELIGKNISIIHAKDYVIKEGKLVSVPCGLGEFNNKLLLEYVKKEKPFIHVLLEDTAPSNAIQAREYMENIYKSL